MRIKPSVVLNDLEIHQIKRIMGFADAQVHAHADFNNITDPKKIRLLSKTLRGLCDETTGAQHHQFLEALKGLNLLHQHLKHRAVPEFWLPMLGGDPERAQQIAEEMVLNIFAQLRDLEPVIEIVVAGEHLSIESELALHPVRGEA
jgi:hypothetical protein